MQLDDIRRIAVVGSGLMGHGIALDFALAGYDVAMHDVSEEKLAHAVTSINSNLQMMTKIGFVQPEQAAGAPARIRTSTALKSVAEDADVVIEAVVENLDVKHRIFRELDSLCPPRTILASNTSSFKPSKLAVVTKRPDKVVIAHYFNPPYLLPLVEIVRGEQTSEETVATMHALLKKIGKQPAIVQKEAAGFIGNRLQVALLREALSIVQQGIATPQDVDVVIKNSIGRRWAFAGIFEIFEIAGWDLLQEICRQIQPEQDATAKPLELIQEKVKSGDLSIKSGRGFYEWTPESAEALKSRIAEGLISVAQHNAKS